MAVLRVNTTICRDLLFKIQFEVAYILNNMYDKTKKIFSYFGKIQYV